MNISFNRLSINFSSLLFSSTQSRSLALALPTNELNGLTLSLQPPLLGQSPTLASYIPWACVNLRWTSLFLQLGQASSQFRPFIPMPLANNLVPELVIPGVTSLNVDLAGASGQGSTYGLRILSQLLQKWTTALPLLFSARGHSIPLLKSFSENSKRELPGVRCTTVQSFPLASHLGSFGDTRNINNIRNVNNAGGGLQLILFGSGMGTRHPTPTTVQSVLAKPNIEDHFIHRPISSHIERWLSKEPILSSRHRGWQTTLEPPSQTTLQPFQSLSPLPLGLIASAAKQSLTEKIPTPHLFPFSKIVPWSVASSISVLNALSNSVQTGKMALVQKTLALSLESRPRLQSPFMTLLPVATQFISPRSDSTQLIPDQLVPTQLVAIQSSESASSNMVNRINQTIDSTNQTSRISTPADSRSLSAPIHFNGGIHVQVLARTVDTANAEETAKVLANHVLREINHLVEQDRFRRGLPRWR